MQKNMKNPVQIRLHLLPRVSARNVMKIAQLAIFTMPYTPVANRPSALPVTPRSAKIVGA